MVSVVLKAEVAAVDGDGTAYLGGLFPSAIGGTQNLLTPVLLASELALPAPAVPGDQVTLYSDGSVAHQDGPLAVVEKAAAAAALLAQQAAQAAPAVPDGPAQG